MRPFSDTLRARLQLSAAEVEAVEEGARRTERIWAEAVKVGPNWYCRPAGEPTAEQVIAPLGLSPRREAALHDLIMTLVRERMGGGSGHD